MPEFEIRKSNPADPMAVALLDELSLDLARKTGRDGRASFAASDMDLPRSVFLVATEDGEAVGYGALRPINETTCEIKRMFTRRRSQGIGTAILKALEANAIAFGYGQAWLETGIENESAVQFYRRNDYKTRENFGKYKGRPECLCFEKILGV